MADQVPRELFELSRILVDRFDLGELRTLCLRLGFRYDDLSDGGITDKAQELVLSLYRRGQVDELVRLLIQDHDQPSVGIVTVVSEAYAAAKLMVKDGQYYPLGAQQDGGYYLGKIRGVDGHKHSVILPQPSEVGSTVVARCATDLVQVFPTVQVLILVGITGGVIDLAHLDKHARFGDVVVPGEQGIGQTSPDQFPYRPSPRLLEASRDLAEKLLVEGPWWTRLVERAHGLLNQDFFKFKRNLENGFDILYRSKNYNKYRIIGMPKVFTNPTASLSAFKTCPRKPDESGKKVGGKAFEVNGPGIHYTTRIEQIEHLMVCGLCGNCKSCENDVCFDYVAVVAAAYTRGLLESIPGQAAYVGTAHRSISAQAAYTRVLYQPALGQAGRDEALLGAKAAIRTHHRSALIHSDALEFFKRIHEFLQIIRDNYKLINLLPQKLREKHNVLSTQVKRLKDYDAIIYSDWDLLRQQEPVLWEIVDDLLEHCRERSKRSEELSGLASAASSSPNAVGRADPFLGNLWWVEQLDRTRRQLRESVEEADIEKLEIAIDDLGQVLRVEPKKINTYLVGTAQALTLPLSGLVLEMEVVQGHLAGLDRDQVAARQFAKCIDTLRSLYDRLTALVDEHNRWQEISDMVVDDIEENLEHCVIKLKRIWPELKSETCALCGTSTRGWAVSLHKAMRELESSLTSNVLDDEILVMSFRRYRSAIDRRFTQVDRDLLNLCVKDLSPICRRELPWISQWLDRA